LLDGSRINEDEKKKRNKKAQDRSYNRCQDSTTRNRDVVLCGRRDKQKIEDEEKILKEQISGKNKGEIKYRRT
jgi:hypothetical protein